MPELFVYPQRLIKLQDGRATPRFVSGMRSSDHLPVMVMRDGDLHPPPLWDLQHLDLCNFEACKLTLEPFSHRNPEIRSV